MLWADGVPFFPRMIEYQGEPLARLKQLGFNTVKFPDFPAEDLRVEAQRLGLWLVCPPPAAASAAPSGPDCQRVLA
ncbi:MAG: hypothetical protein GTO03_14845, partial [Planctomycetales bacterium]|nr:hypothetical protein [Planctomycetales bacterium]